MDAEPPSQREPTSCPQGCRSQAPRDSQSLALGVPLTAFRGPTSRPGPDTWKYGVRGTEPSSLAPSFFRDPPRTAEHPGASDV